ncbi:hypothetical protein FQN60_000926 [Etheostoma spectabile]|uniref:Uncharacterized protein n=1 Tax=Etheostoma spectabile TaxID=54343 RepID=A0A5J5D2I5_9PERO|nr:hypothetical protein FQN60_000926 [Etheostoma spectabile]
MVWSSCESGVIEGRLASKQIVYLEFEQQQSIGSPIYKKTLAESDTLRSAIARHLPQLVPVHFITLSAVNSGNDRNRTCSKLQQWIRLKCGDCGVPCGREVSWRRLPATYVPISSDFFYTMSSGSAQDVAVEHFLRDIERRSKRLHCAVIGCEEARPRSDMNLLYRKSRLDWRQRDQEGSKKRSLDQGFLTHSGNWRPWCWQQRSTSWQHQASGGVGQQVGQRDMMSDESRAELCQSSGGEKQDITSDDYKQRRIISFSC